MSEKHDENEGVREKAIPSLSCVWERKKDTTQHKSPTLVTEKEWHRGKMTYLDKY